MKRVKFSIFPQRRRSSEEKSAYVLFRRFRWFEWCSSSFGSIVFHLTILLLLFLLTRGGGHNDGIGSRKTDEIGIVFSESIHSDSSESAELTSSDSDDGTEESVANETIEESLHETLENLLPTNEIGLTEISGGSSAQMTINAATSGGSQGNAGAAGGQTVGFGGVLGSGKSFVYVIDRSDSMGWKGGAPLRRAVADAVASVQSLDAKLGATKFQVVVFNHDVDVFDNGSSLIDVNPANKAKCARFLKSIVATGGTSPEQALMAGVKMRPDVVFFLTDADEELTENTLARVQTLRRQCKVRQICVIEFGKSTEPAKKTYKRLAGENGGSYIFKDVDLF